jgi:type I restriction enzyme M protein
MSLIDRGILSGLISFDEDRKFITYIHQNKNAISQIPKKKFKQKLFVLWFCNTITQRKEL